MKLTRPVITWLATGILVVSIVGGWLLSRASNDGVDANMTSPGVVQDPTLGTNAPVQGKLFSSLYVTAAANGIEAVVESKGTPLVVNFWYSTCEPCKRELPTLGAAANKFLQVQFVGINPTDDADTATQFAQDYGANYPMYLDKSGDSLVAAGVGVMPVTLFVDADGIIRKQHAGELTQDQLDSYILKYFGVSS
ncbi:MAG: TlpA family protein disulfide reductase [Ilumatobacteraceae bacterium]|nr:TlpA family protein disulfide reductase [Ilumatobacteraceae bacterium]